MKKEYMTIPEVATLLRVSTGTVYQLIHRDALPALKVGNKWRFKKDILNDWVQKQIQSPFLCNN